MNYTTIKALAKASFIEKRSEFIGYLCPVSTNDEAVNFINNIKFYKNINLLIYAAL